MGLTYGYDVYLRPRNVAGALAAVAELAPPSRDVPPLDVTLPGGERITLPFTSGFRSEPVDCSARDTLDLDTSLMFPVDDAVLAYAESYGLPPEEEGRVRIGYVYLTVRFVSFLDPGYAALEFWAATSGMSRLFERSASIREDVHRPRRRRRRRVLPVRRGRRQPRGGVLGQRGGGFPSGSSTVARKRVKAARGKVRVARAGALLSRTATWVDEVAISTQLLPSPSPEYDDLRQLPMGAHSSFVRRWMKSRDCSGSSDADSTLRKLVR
ncbi:hypothetical protein RKD44_004945 [Streptomyces collinus]